MLGASLALVDTADNLGAVGESLLGVESTLSNEMEDLANDVRQQMRNQQNFMLRFAREFGLVSANFHGINGQ